MNLRDIRLTAEQVGLGYFTLSGVIVEATGVFTGTITLIESADGTVTTEAATGIIAAIGASPESLPTTLVSTTPAFTVTGSATIATDGTTTLDLAGLAPDGTTAIAVTLNGTTTAFPVMYETPQSAESGLEVINGVTVNESCALADQLRAVRLQLIAGQAVSRTEFGGRSLYFQKADLAELTKEIEKLDAQCAVASGTTTTTPDLTTRTRRQIRMNPYN